MSDGENVAMDYQRAKTPIDMNCIRLESTLEGAGYTYIKARKASSQVLSSAGFETAKMWWDSQLLVVRKWRRAGSATLMMR